MLAGFFGTGCFDDGFFCFFHPVGMFALVGNFIGVDDTRDKRMPDDVGAGKLRKGDATHIFQNVQGIDQAAFLVALEIDLGDVAGDDGPAAESDTGEKHFHLFRRRVLGLVQNDEGVVQRPAAHVGQRGDFDGLFLETFLGAFETEQIVERIVQRAKIRIDFLGQIAGQKAEAFAGLDGRTGQDNALYGIAFHGIDRTGHGKIGLAGTGRSDTEGDVVFQYGFQVIDLSGSAPAQIGTSRFQDRVGHFGFDQCGSRHARGEIVVDGALFDQCQLDVIDHDGFIGHGIKILDDLETGCRVFAADDEIAAAAGDFDIQRRLNLDGDGNGLLSGTDNCFVYFPDTCRQCEDPACGNACPQKAIITNEQGIRVVDTDKCIGCGACVEACPWHMPTVNPETGKSSKCIACGACVAGCPSGALSIVDWDAVTSAAQAAYLDL